MNKTKPNFVHLHVHTHYSLLDGMSKIPNLIKRVKDLGMNAVAITDHGNMHGAIEFYKEAKKNGIKPIIGMEGYVTPNDMRKKDLGLNDERWHITLLAKNNKGYKNLIKLNTVAHLEGFYYKPRVDKKELRKYSEGLIALSGCLGGEVAKSIEKNQQDKALSAIKEYQEIFGKENFYLEVQYNVEDPEQSKLNNALFALSKETEAPLVATGDSHYLEEGDKNAHDILLAIQTGNKINDEKRLRLNHLDLSLVSPRQMADAFADHPEALENTQKIADMCDVEIELGKSLLPQYEAPEGYTKSSYLRKQCAQGFKTRYSSIDISAANDFEKDISAQIKEENDIVKRLDYELNLIIKMGFEAYMLIVADLVGWAKKNKIIVGPGRGSAAGSIVSYTLGITNIDPIKYNLLFERFLNPDRISMPDIDLDFDDARRDEVLEYVANKYGRDKVAQIITFGTMASRVAIRDVGRVLDYPYAYCDRLAKLIPANYSLERAIKEIDEVKTLYKQDPQAKTLLDNALKLEGVARHTSTHACGVVITEEPIIETTPLQYASNEDKAIITQYEMHAIEDLGLLKMDFLGLKNLTIIGRALEEVKRTKNIYIDIDNLPEADQKTFALLKQGDTTGVFQLESGGMRRYLKDLEPTSIEDIIVMISLYRPGPMDLLPNYINRKHGKEAITYVHPKLEPILKNTYGVGVYQEQMMQIARDLAGFTLAEADTLRKAIGKKIKGLLDEQQEKLIKGMIKNGIDKQAATKVWNLFPPFARYGFNRSHAACYAQISYQTAYLKAHHPTEFMVSLLNAESKNIDRLSFLIEEADRHKIKILPPSIKESGPYFTGAGEGVIRFGLTAIKNIGSNVVDFIIQEKKKNGEFVSLENFLERVGGSSFNRKSLESLIKTGALDSFGERNQLLENIETLLAYGKEQSAMASSGQFSLFGKETGTKSPSLSLKKASPASEQELLGWEKELLGFYVSGHPLKQYRDKMEGCVPIQQLKRYQYTSARVAGLINSTKKIITKRGDPMLFFDIEDFTGRIEAVAFPNVFAQNQDFLEEGKIIFLEGKVDIKDGEPKFLCDSVKEII